MHLNNVKETLRNMKTPNRYKTKIYWQFQEIFNKIVNIIFISTFAAHYWCFMCCLHISTTQLTTFPQDAKQDCSKIIRYLKPISPNSFWANYEMHVPPETFNLMKLLFYCRQFRKLPSRAPLWKFSNATQVWHSRDYHKYWLTWSISLGSGWDGLGDPNKKPSEKVIKTNGTV